MEKGESVIAFRDVPAEVCDTCGGACVSLATAAELDRVARLAVAILAARFGAPSKGGGCSPRPTTATGDICRYRGRHYDPPEKGRVRTRMVWLHRDPLETAPPAWTLSGLHITAQNAVWIVCDQTPWVQSRHDWIAIASAKCNVEGRCLEVMFMVRVHHHAHLREHGEPGWVQARRLLEERLNHRAPDETQLGEVAVEAGDFDRY